MTPEEIVTYYQKLLIQQYVDKPRAKATVEAFVRSFIAEMLYATVMDGFDINTAVGVQLDILAQYRGLKRDLYGVDFGRDYLSLAFYDDSDEAVGALPGFAFYDDVDGDITVYFLMYADADRFSYSMNDDELRRLLKLRIHVQSTYLGLGEIDEILYSVFGAFVTLTDDGTMAIIYTHDPGDINSVFDLAVATNTLPRPAGVALTTA